jgi:hypothetical protein
MNLRNRVDQSRRGETKQKLQHEEPRVKVVQSSGSNGDGDGTLINME